MDTDDGAEKTATNCDEDAVEDLPLKTWLLVESRAFAQRFAKSFLKATALYAGASTLSAFMKNPFRTRVPRVWAHLARLDCLRFAAFLGLYPSLYHATVSALRRFRKRKDGWNYSMAGCLAGLSLALDSPSRHKAATLFAVARALGAGATTLVARGLVRALPHAETLVFCAECAMAVTAVACFPHLLAPGYYRSVLKWSRDYTDAKTTVLFRNPGERFLTCAEAGLHEGTCTTHALKDFLRSLPAFAKLYLPIHLIPVVLFKRKQLKERPAYVLKSLANNLTMSTLFLSTMVFVAKYVICLLRNASGRPPPLPAYIPCAAGFLCGLAVLWERSSRRKELIMFLTPHVLDMLYALGQRSCLGRRLHVPHAFPLLFAAAMGVVMHAYERDPPSLSMLMSGLLRFFVGERREKGPGSPRNQSVQRQEKQGERKVA